MWNSIDLYSANDCDDGEPEAAEEEALGRVYEGAVELGGFKDEAGSDACAQDEEQDNIEDEDD